MSSNQLFYVFDLDGTLANDLHRRHFVEQRPKDYTAYFGALYDDSVNVPLVEIMHSLIYTGHKVEIWTARALNSGPVWLEDDGSVTYKVKQDTDRWFEDKFWPALRTPWQMYPRIRSRDATDFRKLSAADLKTRWCKLYGRPDAVFDDREETVARWRELGIPCYQVANNT